MSETLQEAAEAFVAELQHWRDVRSLARKALSERMSYDPSYVGKVESGGARPTEDFARRADEVLQAGGALRRRWKEYDLITRRSAHAERPAEPTPVESMPQPASGLVVEHDDAELAYADGVYLAKQRRRITNIGTEPVTRYLMRISVDRFPGDPARSNDLYRSDPLTWNELRLTAHCGADDMAWTVKQDRDAFKEVWLLFENQNGRFPLYPGQSTWIEYAYYVREDLWGQWFQRAVRLPTQRLSVRLVLPAGLDPAVWGMETSMTAEAYPFRTAIEQHDQDGNRVFSWATASPPLHARYRLEWNFRARQAEEKSAQVSTPTLADKMVSIGIVQEGDPILRQVAVPFNLPAEAEDARRVVTELNSAIERALTIHNFTKGLGVAAPQIGIGRAAAVIRTPDGETVTLLNPQVIDQSTETDEQYEGCWSFFNVRGQVPRPLAIEVEHQAVDGIRHITTFKRNVARLVGHEIDHLNGMLYVDRMRPGFEPIPVSEYKGKGRVWTYLDGRR